MQAPITCGVKGQTATKLHSMSRKLVWELTEFANNIELDRLTLFCWLWLVTGADLL